MQVGTPPNDRLQKLYEQAPNKNCKTWPDQSGGPGGSSEEYDASISNNVGKAIRNADSTRVARASARRQTGQGNHGQSTSRQGVAVALQEAASFGCNIGQGFMQSQQYGACRMYLRASAVSDLR